jgi:hypothetical protein
MEALARLGEHVATKTSAVAFSSVIGNCSLGLFWRVAGQVLAALRAIPSRSGFSATRNFAPNSLPTPAFIALELQARSRSPFDFTCPLTVLITEVRARTSTACARITVRSD